MDTEFADRAAQALSEQMVAGSIVIEHSRSLDKSRAFRLLESTELPMSWSEKQPMFVYQHV